MLVVAHAGHWILDAAPVIAALGWVGVHSFRTRRRERRERDRRR